MRTALRCSARLSVASHTILRSPVWRRAACQSLIENGFPSKKHRRLATTASGRLTKQEPSRRPLKRLQVSDTKDPKAFVALYDEFLPADLRIDDRNLSEQSQFDLQRIVAIKSYAARQQLDVWVWMAQNGYRKQLASILNRGLNECAMKSRPEQSTPSNIDWPATIFDDLHYNEKPLESLSVTWLERASLDDLTDAPSKTSRLENEFLGTVWLTLTRLVLAAGEPESEVGETSMRTVLLVLATMHNLDMIPKDIYAYKSLTLSSTVVRPPILHLFSSRILTSLSDATWREHQDEAIAQATQLGHSLKHISENAPGGRFRLKVQPLPVELWLELILWCCVDSGRNATAYKIINMLHHSEDPWFAVRWCSTQTSPLAETLVDWNRVRLRNGGVVGRIEGYSREKPFADVPEKTISAEVVLALIEAIATGNARFSAFNEIADLVHFLEPHDLPPSYFDYLESRLLLAGVYDNTTDLTQVEERSQQFTSLRSLKTIKEVPRATQTLELDAVLDHSLLHIGVMQQSLNALISHGAVHNALELFNNIQEQVDQNKVQSIMEFVQNETHPYRLEYADSHGQIPYHRLAMFLDLATEAKMLGLGEWLLYADDLDDALIPSSAYSATSMAPSLTRYASANNDPALLARIHANFDTHYTSSKQRPSVRTYRAFFDADVESLNLRNVAQYLTALKARGARIGLTNFAYLAAAILRIENGDTSGQPISRETLRRRALDLLDKMLSGQFYRSASSETFMQKMQYKQQVSHILRVFAQCENSCLRDLATKHAPDYASGNNVMLYTRVFNVLLDGIVNAYGAFRGQEIYEMFCRNFSAVSEQLESDSEDAPHVEESSEPRDEEYDKIDTAEEFVDSYFGQEIAAPEEIDPNASNRFLRPMPITSPHASTLRVIVRAALAQENADKQTIMEWAVKHFSLIGTKNINVIAQEIQRPLTEVDLRNIRLLKYQISQDYHAMAADDQGLHQARVEHLARQMQGKKRKARKVVEETLWAELIPSFHD